MSIGLTIVGLLGFSVCREYWMMFLFAIPYGVGAVISPYIMALALKYARWKEGYSWTSYIQMLILLVCIISLPLWKVKDKNAKENYSGSVGIKETIKIPAVIFTLIAFYAYGIRSVTRKNRYRNNAGLSVDFCSNKFRNA